MIQLDTGEPVWDLEFDEKGALVDAAAEQALISGAGDRGVSDLVVFSHGWGSSRADAENLYAGMFPLIRDAFAQRAGLGPVGFVRVFWPSLWFPPTNATPPASLASTQADGGPLRPPKAGTEELTGAQIADSLKAGFADQGARDTLTEIGALIDQGQQLVLDGGTDDAKRALLEQISTRIAALTPAGPGPDASGVEDRGETGVLLATDPMAAYAATAGIFGTAPSSGAQQGFGDIFGKAVQGAKDALRVFSYAQMKTRAGTIGQQGLGPLLARLRQQQGAIRVHLAGHSFGARLVSFALAGVGQPGDSPIASLTLVQGAFSHWSFSPQAGNPFGVAGALDGYGDRVHGPLVATHSVYDWAVGVWYPRASFLTQQDQSDSTPAGRWNGMGSDGFQGATPCQSLTMPAAGPVDYGLTAGTFYRVDAQAVIDNVQGQSFAGAHSDIRKPMVADLIAQAAAAHA